MINKVCLLCSSCLILFIYYLVSSMHFVFHVLLWLPADDSHHIKNRDEKSLWTYRFLVLLQVQYPYMYPHLQ